jgi:ATP-dependent RNA helicase SUPV3L1/SUV3
MLAHSSGMIGLPLRLLAREVYNKVSERAGKEAVALITGEEKIKPSNPRYWVSTVEAMPRDIDVAFMAIDEVQLGADFERGHVFTDRMLNARAREETLVLGAATVRQMVEKLLPGAHVISRPRLSTLTSAGEKKLTRLPSRSAIVAFSAEEVYAIAELIRRQRGGRRSCWRAFSAHAQRAGRPINRATTTRRPTPLAWASTSTSTTPPRPDQSSTAISSASSIRPSLRRSPAAPAARRATERSHHWPRDPFEPDLVQALEATPSSRSGCNGATLVRFCLDRRPQPRSQRRRMNKGSRVHRSARIFVLEHAARDEDVRALAAGSNRPFMGCLFGFLTIGRLHPPRMPNWP